MYFLIKDVACDGSLHEGRVDTGKIITKLQGISIVEGFYSINLAFMINEKYNTQISCGCKSRVENI